VTRLSEDELLAAYGMRPADLTTPHERETRPVGLVPAERVTSGDGESAGHGAGRGTFVGVTADGPRPEPRVVRVG